MPDGRTNYKQKTKSQQTAQHIHKQKIYFSSTINALQNGTKLGASLHAVLMLPREKTDKQ